MLYAIEARDWSGPDIIDGNGPYGYVDDDYLPGFGEKMFASADEAQAWIVANHKGPDCDGVMVAFAVVEYTQ